MSDVRLCSGCFLVSIDTVVLWLIEHYFPIFFLIFSKRKLNIPENLNNPENIQELFFAFLPWLSFCCNAVLRLARSADEANGKFNLSNPFMMFG